MPPERTGPEDPGEWLRRARSNLARARAKYVDADVLLEDLCFDTQQACEKCLKALFVFKGRPVPRTHSIGDLLTALSGLGFDVPEAVMASAVLTDYAVSARYPGPSEPVTVDDLAEAIRLADGVLSWASSIVSGA